MKDHGYVASGELNDYLKEMFADRARKEAFIKRAEESERSAALLCWSEKQRELAFKDYCAEIANGDARFPETKAEVEAGVLRHITQYRTEAEERPEPKIAGHGDSLVWGKSMRQDVVHLNDEQNKAVMEVTKKALDTIEAKLAATMPEGPPCNALCSSIIGEHKIGGRLSLTTSAWTGRPSQYRYEWTRVKWDGTKLDWIKSVVSNKDYLLLTPDEDLCFIYCSITAMNKHGSMTIYTPTIDMDF